MITKSVSAPAKVSFDKFVSYEKSILIISIVGMIVIGFPSIFNLIGLKMEAILMAIFLPNALVQLYKWNLLKKINIEEVSAEDKLLAFKKVSKVLGRLYWFLLLPVLMIAILLNGYLVPEEFKQSILFLGSIALFSVIGVITYLDHLKQIDLLINLFKTEEKKD